MFETFRVTLNREPFLKALERVRRVARPNKFIPIFEAVVLRAGPTWLTLSATNANFETDSKLEMRVEIEATVAQQGNVVVNAAQLYKVVKGLPKGAQTILIGNEYNLELASGHLHAKFDALPEKDLPEPLVIVPTDTFSISAQELSFLFGKTSHAISTEETRYYLNGVYLHSAMCKGQHLLRAVATDGHRLAHVEVYAPEGMCDTLKAIVPRETVAEVLKMLHKASGMVDVEVSRTSIRFTFGQTVLTSRLIEGYFPDYTQVIPRHNDKMLTVNKEAFEQTLKSIYLKPSAGKSRPVVKLTMHNGNLTMSTETGSNSVPISFGAKSDTFEISFDVKYLLDMLPQIDEGVLIVKMDEPSSPTLFYGTASPTSIFVVMSFYPRKLKQGN